MPILDVDQAQQVVFLKRSMRPGFAGIENELLYDPKTTLLFGDAKESLDQGGQQRQDPLSAPADRYDDAPPPGMGSGVSSYAGRWRQLLGRSCRGGRRGWTPCRADGQAAAVAGCRRSR